MSLYLSGLAATKIIPAVEQLTSSTLPLGFVLVEFVETIPMTGSANSIFSIFPLSSIDSIQYSISSV